MALVKEDLIVEVRPVSSLGLIILSFDLEIRRFAVCGGKVHVLFRETFFIFFRFGEHVKSLVEDDVCVDVESTFLGTANVSA